jgi:general secretion pathway protein D
VKTWNLSKCSRGLGQFAWVGGTLLTLFLSLPAQAQSELVIKLYECPPGKAAATAETLRNEFGYIRDVRVAADERTSRVFVQAPPAVQSRIGQRMVAEFPNLQPANMQPSGEKPSGDRPADNSLKTRQILLNRIQGTQLDAALWTNLANRLTVLPAERPQLRNYRLTSTGGGTVTIQIDLSTRQVKLDGASDAVDAATRLIQVLDLPPDRAGKNIRLMPVAPTELASVQRAASLLRASSGKQAVVLPLAAQVLQPTPDAPAAGNPVLPPLPGTPPETAAPGAPGAEKPPVDFGSLSRINSPVQVEVIEGLDVLVLRGGAQDLDEIAKVVKYIEEITRTTEPAIEIMPMRHIQCDSLAAMVKSLYDEVYLPRQGAVSITPMMVPDAILVVGRPENVKTVRELVDRLDQPTIPGSQFHIFVLRHASVSSALATVQNVLLNRGELSPDIRVTADVRTSSLIVQAGARDMADVAELLRRIDVGSLPEGQGPYNELRIIRLEHTRAQDIASILQTAIGGAGNVPQQGTGPNQQAPGGPNQPGGAGGPGGPGGGQIPGQNPQVPGGGQPNATANQRVAMLRFLMVDAKGKRLLNSGILTDVRITYDVTANAILISSPPENLELLEGLVRQLDNLPAAEAQIKVFTIINGDATSLSQMLTTLFTGQATGTAAGPQQILQLLQSTSSSSETSLVPVRFGVDTRTNSVIASGTIPDLNIVEAILTKLDDGEVRHRKSVVIRLKNSPAQDVATTITTFLTNERTLLQQAGPGVTTPFEQIDREVVVVAEPVTNSLVLSATPKYYEEVRNIIEQLDARPPMVMIQVMIASVALGKTNEFGIELGLQDSVLFDRSILSNLQTTTTTSAAGVATQSVVSGNGAPGFNFNNGGDLGNLGTLPAGSGVPQNTSPSAVAGQGISNFGTGRTNSTLGYSGLVLSAASQNVSALLRALAENHRVDILQRPQIMTLDNQPAFVQVGQRVPRITGVTNNAVTGNVNTITLDNVGLILGVTPRISPDGLVVMQIDAENSKLESEATGIPIFTSPTGQVTRSPIIDATTAQTTVAAMSEQTVVLGGLITKTKSKEHHGVPVIDDIPVLNNFFRYDSEIEEKTELLIIMTPHIVKNQAEAEAIKRTEAAKMTWCINDVTAIYGEAGLRRRTDEWSDAEVPVVYPDGIPCPLPEPGKPAAPETIPTPTSQPTSQPAGPAGGAPQNPPHAELQNPSPLGQDDQAASIRRYGPPRPAPYQADANGTTPGVQAASYGAPAWQGNNAQPAVYQPSHAEQDRYAQPARYESAPSYNNPQQQPPDDSMPPPYYPPAAGASSQGTYNR